MAFLVSFEVSVGSNLSVLAIEKQVRKTRDSIRRDPLDWRQHRMNKARCARLLEELRYYLARQAVRVVLHRLIEEREVDERVGRQNRFECGKVFAALFVDGNDIRCLFKKKLGQIDLKSLTYHVPSISHTQHPRSILSPHIAFHR